MAILGGSPLGLIGLKSVPTNGMSGFNAGASRNVIVADYNRSKSLSLFTGKRRLRAWPNLAGKVSSYKPDATTNPGAESTESQDTTGLADVYVNAQGKLVDGYTPSIEANSRGSNLLHNNDVYDTSVLNILEKLAKTKAALRPTDFAYLKYLGVYPNNRLMIARRFVAPSGDNIMVNRTTKEVPSIATLVSWIPEGTDFLEISFGEVWTDAKADFTGMLNSLGEDFSKSGAGKIAGAAANVLPLPGFTEIFQRAFLAKIGLLEEGAENQIPAGNPNLVKEAKVRKTIGYSEAGSGLTAKVTIKMTCEYELKFIAGIDPTIVWMDIIGMIVRFGTSESSNYGLSQGVAAKLARWAANPYTLISDVVSGIKNAISSARKALEDAVTAVYNAATDAAKNLSDGSTSGDEKEISEKAAAEAAASEAKDTGFNLIAKLVDIGESVIKAAVMKYRVEVMGIVNALTGNPSTPWHITIGNPMRPVFCSGDMLTTNVVLKLGPNLAFNDLPSSIIAEFELTNARNLGMQEIMAKFNSGYLRTVDVQKTFFETTVKFGADGKVASQEPVGVMPGEAEFKSDLGTSGTSGAGTSGTNGNQGGGNTNNGNTSGKSGDTSGTQGTQGTQGNIGKTETPTNVKEIPGSGTQKTLTKEEQAKLDKATADAKATAEKNKMTDKKK
jgi:hypothetical protein